MEYICSWDTYCTTQPANPECSYTVLRSATYAVCMQLSCILNGILCTTFVVEPCFILKLCSTERNLTVNALHVIEHEQILTVPVLQKSHSTRLRSLGGLLCIHVLFYYLCFTMFVLQKIVSNHLITTIDTCLPTHITLTGLNIHYISCNYVLSYAEAYPERCHCNWHRYKV